MEAMKTVEVNHVAALATKRQHARALALALGCRFLHIRNQCRLYGPSGMVIAITTSDTLGSEEAEGATALDALMSGSL
jgi:hypothetical protein